MEIITSLSFYLPSNINHEIKLEKIEQQENTYICGSPNMGYVHGKGSIFHYYENRSPRLHGILTYASVQARSPNHVTIMCVKRHTQHVMCDELQ